MPGDISFAWTMSPFWFTWWLTWPLALLWQTNRHLGCEAYFLNKTAILREKNKYLSRIFRPPFAEPFCHPIFRKNLVYLSRVFRPPFAEPFCRSLSQKKGYFREAFAELSRTILKNFNGHNLLNPLQGAFDRSSYEQCFFWLSSPYTLHQGFAKATPRLRGM